MLRILINIVIGLSALVTMFIIGIFVAGLVTSAFDGEGGMVILAFFLYGAIMGGLTILLSLIGYLVGRGSEPPRLAIPKTGLAIGSLCLLTLGGLMLFA